MRSSWWTATSISTARFRALPLGHETRKEIVTALGGTPDTVPDAYAARSPSNHLDGLVAAVRGGMRFVDVWSVSDGERREFRGATCSLTANATWLAALASKLGRPVTGYVTQMRHAHALWDRGMGLMQLAVGPNDGKPLRCQGCHVQAGRSGTGGQLLRRRARCLVGRPVQFLTVVTTVFAPTLPAMSPARTVIR